MIIWTNKFLPWVRTLDWFILWTICFSWLSMCFQESFPTSVLKIFRILSILLLQNQTVSSQHGKLAAYTVLILVEIDTSWNLSIFFFPPRPSLFLLNAGLQHILWLLVPLLLLVNPKRKKLKTISVSSLSIPRLFSLISFHLYLNLVSCFHCAPWFFFYYNFQIVCITSFQKCYQHSIGHWCFFSNFTPANLNIYSEYKLTK